MVLAVSTHREGTYLVRRLLVAGGLGLALGLCAAPGSLNASDPYQRPFTKALATTPDLLQTDPKARFPGRGRQMCGPVAAANAFMHLSVTGFPRLAPRARTPWFAHVDVARTLSGPAYMNTSLQEGTGTAGVMHGVARYARDRGYKVRRLSYTGWRPHPKAYRSMRITPDVTDVEISVRTPGSLVLLNVGWYQTQADGRLQRLGGHWVTLAGYGVNAKGEEAVGTWIIRDPSPRSGPSPRYHFARRTKQATAQLVGSSAGLPRRLAQAVLLDDALPRPRGADATVIDGVVTLWLTPAPKPVESLAPASAPTESGAAKRKTPADHEDPRASARGENEAK